MSLEKQARRARLIATDKRIPALMGVSFVSAHVGVSKRPQAGAFFPLYRGRRIAKIAGRSRLPPSAAPQRARTRD